jgi:uncharacterized membrane protein
LNRPPANTAIDVARKADGSARRLRWSGQLSLSLLWASHVGVLPVPGFRALRAAKLALFGLTLVKTVVVDISELRQFYRIVARLALGLVLLDVA